MILGGGAQGRCGCGEPFTSTRLQGEWAEQEHRATRTEAMPQCQYKKVRSGGCFAAHLLFFSCAGVGRVVRRVSLGVGCNGSGAQI